MMVSTRNRNLIIGGSAIAIVILLLSVFTVDETETAIRFQFGEIVTSGYEPGLHFKVPLINNIRKFDARVQNLDTDPERFLTAEKKNLMVDSFVKWRIGDVRRYFTAVAGDPLRANLRLDQILKDGLRSEFSKRTVQEVVSGERTQIMEILARETDAEAAELGIEVLDVRIKRVDLPAEVSTSVFRRMRAERERIAREFRSRGAEAAERIQAEADRERTVLLANAYRDAEIIRGDGDATAAEIYANAFNADRDFFSLSRSLSAYQRSLGNGEGTMVLEPDSEFLRYFRQSYQSELPRP